VRSVIQEATDYTSILLECLVTFVVALPAQVQNSPINRTTYATAH